MTTVSAERLATIFVEVADTLVDDFDLIEFLHMLTDRTASLIGAAAVGLVLADKDGRLEFMAGSDENVRLLELFQPCRTLGGREVLQDHHRCPRACRNARSRV